MIALEDTKPGSALELQLVLSQLAVGFVMDLRTKGGNGPWKGLSMHMNVGRGTTWAKAGNVMQRGEAFGGLTPPTMLEATGQRDRLSAIDYRTDRPLGGPASLRSVGSSSIVASL